MESLGHPGSPVSNEEVTWCRVRVGGLPRGDVLQSQQPTPMRTWLVSTHLSLSWFNAASLGASARQLRVPVMEPHWQPSVFAFRKWCWQE